MKRLINKIYPLLFMLFIPLVNIFYPFLNNSSRGVHYLVLNIDNKIPFVKIFCVPYMLWYPLIIFCLVLFCNKDKRVYYNALSSQVLGMIVCFIVYSLFQTSVPRPELAGNDVLTNIIRFIYNTDLPYNCFPSIHVMSSYIMVRAAYDTPAIKKKDAFFIALSSFLVIISTQLIKQHVILDLISGVMLGEFIYKLVGMYGERGLLWIKKRYLLWMTKKKLEI